MAPFFQFFKSANGIFALRMGLVSVALWVPAVCHSSAWIYYSNKGLWGLIMAQVCFIFSFFLLCGDIFIQTALAVYAGDQVGIASFFEGAMLIHSRLQVFSNELLGRCWAVCVRRAGFSSFSYLIRFVSRYGYLVYGSWVRPWKPLWNCYRHSKLFNFDYIPTFTLFRL